MLFEKPKAIGQRVTIDYFDQNIRFETIFPKKGIITQAIIVNGQKLFILDLDESFVYNSVNCKKIIIKERQIGHQIGDNAEVHVHVFLPRTELNKEKYLFDDFDHVVWATVKPIK